MSKHLRVSKQELKSIIERTSIPKKKRIKDNSVLLYKKTSLVEAPRKIRLEYTGNIIPLNQKLLPLKGRMVVKKEYRECWQDVKRKFAKECQSYSIDERSNYFIQIYLPSRFDVDALVKPILDSLENIVYKNDKQVIGTLCKKRIGLINEFIVLVCRL